MTPRVRLRARERGGPGGLAGLVSLLGPKSGAGPFLFLYSFSISDLILWIDFQMISKSFEFKLFLGFYMVQYSQIRA